jgi:predicted aspartyl protease
MGHIEAKIKISNLDKTKSKEVMALADTRATLTVIPQRIADELDLEEVVTTKVATGAGEMELKLERAVARIRIGERETVQDVLVSEIIDRVLLGVVGDGPIPRSSDRQAEGGATTPLLSTSHNSIATFNRLSTSLRSSDVSFPIVRRTSWGDRVATQEVTTEGFFNPASAQSGSM